MPQTEEKYKQLRTKFIDYVKKRTSGGKGTGLMELHAAFYEISSGRDSGKKAALKEWLATTCKGFNTDEMAVAEKVSRVQLRDRPAETIPRQQQKQPTLPKREEPKDTWVSPKDSILEKQDKSQKHWENRDEFWVFKPETRIPIAGISQHNWSLLEVGGHPVNIIENFLTPNECKWWVDKVYPSGQAKNLSREFPTWYRTGNRLLISSTDAASAIFERVMAAVPPEHLQAIPRGFGVKTTSPWTPSLCNNVFRLVRYSENGLFQIHRDANHVRSPGLRSAFTVMVYLNDDYEGGDLIFTKPGPEPAEYEVPLGSPPPPSWKANLHLTQSHRIVPKAGLAVVFPHHLIHFAQPVISGYKYILRTDLIYTTEGADEEFVNGWETTLPSDEQFAYNRVLEMNGIADQAEQEGRLEESQRTYDAMLEVRYSFGGP
eukprot:TRINITY_DN2096_c8_g1_i1.p1 TRINITY_DN2096_c8_g1~~TRINITY_DN2096_c8_g1_i1.p1  ORF type:complete len:446 (+),score=40.42 TRINITY_DN2096_c8_g1_i1:47-1339(+)